MLDINLQLIVMLLLIVFQDFKNFQYTLPRVTGMHVHLEDNKVVIQLPQNRYDEVSSYVGRDIFVYTIH